MNLIRHLSKVITTALLVVGPSGALPGADTIQFTRRFTTAAENAGSVRLDVIRAGRPSGSDHNNALERREIGFFGR